MNHRPHRPDHGYTLLEMAVVLAVLAVVSVAGFATYRDHVETVQDRGATVTVTQAATDAQELVLASESTSGDGSQAFTWDTLEEAVGGLSPELLSYTPGIHAAAGFTLTTGASTAFGIVSTDLSRTASATDVTLAMLSRSGNCAKVHFTVDGLPTSEVAAVASGGTCTGGSAAVTSPTGPPAPVSTLTCAPQDGAVELAWTVPAGQSPASFDVYLNGALEASEAGAARTSTVAGLDNGTSYSFSVVTFDALGRRSDTSETATCTPADTAAPTAPELTVTAGVRRASLVWTAATDTALAGYRVYRTSPPTGEQLMAAVSTATFSYLDTGQPPSGLSPATTYTYRVEAYDAAGNATSDSAQVVPGDDGPPGVPQPSATAGVGTVALTWSQVSAPYADLAGYRVYRCVPTATVTCATAADFQLRQQVLSSTATSWSDTSLDAGREYRYRVTSVDDVGNESAQSSTVSGTTTAFPAPPTVAASATGTTVTWTWDVPAGTTAFETQGQSTSTGSAAGVADASDLPASTTTRSFTGQATGTQFTMSVRACSAAGCSAWAAASTWTVPAAPSSLAATGSGVRQVPLSWQPPTGTVTSYKVYRGTTSSSAAATLVNTVTSPVAGAQAWTSTGLANGTQYWFWTTAVNAGGESARSAVATATTLALPSNVSYATSQCVFGYSSTPTAFSMQYPQQCQMTLTATGATSYGSITLTGPGFSQVVANNAFTSSLPYMGGADSLNNRMLASGGQACNAAGCTTAAADYWSPTPRPGTPTISRVGTCTSTYCTYQFSATKAMNYHVRILNPHSSAKMYCWDSCSGGDFGSGRTGTGNFPNGLNGVFMNVSCYTGCTRSISVTPGVAVSVSGASNGTTGLFSSLWCWPPGLNQSPVAASCVYSGWAQN